MKALIFTAVVSNDFYISIKNGQERSNIKIYITTCPFQCKKSVHR